MKFVFILVEKDICPITVLCRVVERSDTNDTDLALKPLGAAIDLRNPASGLIHHSDRGSPYASDEYRAELQRHGCVASMSRSGDC